MILRDMSLKDARGCVYCGFWNYGATSVPIGDKAGTLVDDPDLAVLVRKWAGRAGLDWGAAEVNVVADGEGGEVRVSGVDGADDFGERWKAAFRALSREASGAF